MGLKVFQSYLISPAVEKAITRGQTHIVKEFILTEILVRLFTQNFVGDGKDNSEDSGIENVITE